MRQITMILLLAICAGYMVNEADAIFGLWRGGLGGLRRPWWLRPYGGYYGWNWPYYNSYYYNSYYPYYNYWKRGLEGPQAIECTYFEGKSQLACSGIGEGAECEAIRVFDSSITKPFQFFAIGARPESALNETLGIVYDLYPEMLEKKEWLNATYIDAESKKSYTYGLYHNPEFSFSGFRVKDIECWKNMTSLFGRLVANETITVPISGDRKEEIKILGGILLS